MNDLSAESGRDKLAGESTHFPRQRNPPPAFERQARECDPWPPPATVSPLLLLDTIRRRKLSLLITTLFMAFIGAVIALTTRQHYVAIASLMIEDRRPMLSGLAAQAGALVTDTVAARTQVDLLRTSELAEQIAEKLDLPNTGEFARAINRPPSLTDRIITSITRRLWPDDRPPTPTVSGRLVAAADLLREKTTVVNDGRSYVIDIQVKTEDPQLSAALANAYATTYLALKTRIKSDALRRANARFESRLDSLSERANTAEQAVAEYRAHTGLVEDRAAATGVTVAGQQLAQLNAQLVTASNERARLEAALAQIHSLPKRGVATIRISDLPDVLASPLVQRLAEQEAELSGREANLATSHGANDPDLMALRAARRALAHKIETEVDRVVTSLGAATAVAQAREVTLRNQVAAALTQVTEEGRNSVALMGLQNAANAARAVYAEVLNRSATTANEVDLQEPDALVVSQAVAPIAPAFPNRRHLVILDLATAPLVALFVALLRDRLRPGLRSAEAVEAVTGLPCLGFVPKRRGRRGRAAFAGAVAALPATLGHKRPRVVLLTAALPGEGTSVLAEALARSVAEAGPRVLLVICGRGFASPVAPMPNLEIITATPPALPKAPRDRYDLILLDTPAVLATSLALPLAAIADGTILVVRFGHTRAAIVARAVQTLRRHGGHLIGTVVTRVNRAELSDQDGTERSLDRARRRAGRLALMPPMRPAGARSNLGAQGAERESTGQR